MHSLGFKKNTSDTHPKPNAKVVVVLNESDKLNGNNEPAQPPAPPQGASGGRGDGVVLRQRPVCAAAKQPAARASMSSIIKGSVMDKVTHVFNNGVNMGNANNSKASAASSAVASSLANKAKEQEAASVASSPGDGAASASDKITSPAGINIPKGLYSILDEAGPKIVDPSASFCQGGGRGVPPGYFSPIYPPRNTAPP